MRQPGRGGAAHHRAVGAPGEVIGPPRATSSAVTRCALVGYQRDANGVQVRCRNSWGAAWVTTASAGSTRAGSAWATAARSTRSGRFGGCQMPRKSTAPTSARRRGSMPPPSAPSPSRPSPTATRSASRPCATCSPSGSPGAGRGRRVQRRGRDRVGPRVDLRQRRRVENHQALRRRAQGPHGQARAVVEGPRQRGLRGLRVVLLPLFRLPRGVPARVVRSSSCPGPARAPARLYEATGAAFWSGGDWFAEMILAGYKGRPSKSKMRAIRAAVQPSTEHPASRRTARWRWTSSPGGHRRSSAWPWMARSGHGAPRPCARGRPPAGSRRRVSSTRPRSRRSRGRRDLRAPRRGRRRGGLRRRAVGRAHRADRVVVTRALAPLLALAACAPFRADHRRAGPRRAPRGPPRGGHPLRRAAQRPRAGGTRVRRGAAPRRGLGRRARRRGCRAARRRRGSAPRGDGCGPRGRRGARRCGSWPIPPTCSRGTAGARILGRGAGGPDAGGELLERCVRDEAPARSRLPLLGGGAVNDVVFSA